MFGCTQCVARPQVLSRASYFHGGKSFLRMASFALTGAGRGGQGIFRCMLAIPVQRWNWQSTTCLAASNSENACGMPYDGVWGA